MVVLFVPRERGEGESRVAATPETVKKLVAAGLDVRVEAGAGTAARFTDAAYRDAGATVVDESGWGEAGLVCTVGPPSLADVKAMRPDALLVGMLAPHRNDELVAALAERQVAALSMERIPRISRAQAMDALSSQAGVAGYRAVILAAERLDKMFPLSMTAAGTVRPARVVVIGVGVAGLQAVATAKRLGAIVEVSDIREAARGEAESLGAKFIDLPEIEDTEDSGGYAKEQGEDFLTRQREILTEHLAQAHAVITTAMIPGRPAPTLVTAAMVERMQPGSMIVDVAAPEGGNCELTDPGREVDAGGVLILGPPNLASSSPGEASQLYARNITALLDLIVRDGEVVLDREDEIIAAALLEAEA
jgi:H+-translocating NAD(P) transhydrogenase subunit alpha